MNELRKLTPDEQNDFEQSIWDLRNKMVDQLEKLQKIHNKILPTVEDGSSALYTVYDAWNSKEYENLEEIIKKLK